MAVTGAGIDFQWFRYTDAASPANHWAVRVDKAWGTNVASGFSAFVATDPVWPRTRRYRERGVIGVDPISTRKTTLKVGSPTATVYAKGQTFTRFVRGLEDPITFTVTKLIPEVQPASNPNINNPPEYTAPL